VEREGKEKTNKLQTLQLELKNKHNAPKVRTSVGIFMFIRTPLFRGETGQSNFLTPLLHVGTVAEAIVNTIYSGKGRTIYLPGMMRYVAVLVSCFLLVLMNERAANSKQRGLLPEWAFRKIRDDTKHFKIDFRGRHKLDDKGKLDPTQSRDLRN
jgi:all-trans-retinol dehydrogenase (NAD+)